MKKNYFLTILLSCITLIINAQFKMNSAGFVGIGTTTPASRLHIVGNSTFTATTSAITSAAYIRGNNGYSLATTPEYTWYNNDQTGLFHPSSNVIGFSSGGAEKFRVTTEGIEVAAPTAWARCIAVKATNANSVGFHMRYNNVDNFYVHATGYIYSQGQFLGSDKNIKKNIETIKDPMKLLEKINGVTFNWNYPEEVKEMNTDVLNYGFIAQNIEEVIPSLVITATNGFKAVNYDGIIPVLVECVKKQEGVIADLTDKLEENTQYTYFVHSRLMENAPIENYQLKSVRPNPASDNVSVDYVIPGDCKNCEIRMFDLTGIQVLADKLSGSGSSVNLDTSSVLSGTYLISLIVDGRVVAAQRLVIAH
jgi:hypothetical protein